MKSAKPETMILEMRNVKIGPTSEETTNFAGDLYVNGKKAARCSNSGQGGPTDIDPYEGMKDLVSQAEIYTKTLPPHKSSLSDAPFAMDLELWIDLQLSEIETQKNIARLTKKYIVFGNTENSDSLHTMGWKGVTIADMLQPRNINALKQAIDTIKTERLKPGDKIYNTNIPHELLGPLKCFGIGCKNPVAFHVRY